MKRHKITVRLDDESMKQWLNICSTFEGNTRSATFRNIIKKINRSINEISNINNYGK